MGAKEVMTDLAGGSRPRTFKRDGVTLGYSVVGDGQPVLFVHGTTATGEFEWGRLAARLASDYQCVLPDLRGHGRSELGDSSISLGSPTVPRSRSWLNYQRPAPQNHLSW